MTASPRMNEALAPEYTAGQRPITPLQLRELSVKRDAPAFIRVLLQYALIGANAVAIWQVKAMFGIWWALPMTGSDGSTRFLMPM